LGPPSDEYLVEQARRGEQSAFAELVRRQQDFVFSLCFHLCGERGEAEDLAQEAFLRLYRSLPRFKVGSPLRPWLRKLTSNVCLDALRKQRPATLTLEDLGQSGREPRVGAADELPEDACLGREARGDVQQALLRLPPDYRAALVLRYLEDLSYQEIAVALEVPVSTVETRLFRAKKTLGQLLSLAPHLGKEGTGNDLHVARRAGLQVR
jgi:RNA polymerase sigma-70 factor, ECF subfamily